MSFEEDTVRLKFRSYDYEPLMTAVGDLRRRILDKFPDMKFTIVPLPNKKKYYCVNRSPHVNTNSREQFGVDQVSQIAEIKFVTFSENVSPEVLPGGPSTSDAGMNYDTVRPHPMLIELISIIVSYDLPPGVFCEIYSKWKDLSYYLKSNDREKIRIYYN